MIISKTPFRISFFGGGTDYPVWYNDNSGAVLGTTIDKYCYITCRHLPPFFNHKHRIVYSKIENVNDVCDIEHPAVKATLNFMNIKEGMEIHHDGDLPARTGLGSSSSFTVGLLHSLYALKGVMPTKLRLAKEAIHVERGILKETVGSQDQVLASLGGFNRIDFASNDEIKVQPIIMTADRLSGLQKHLMLFFTGFSRFASKIAEEQVANTHKKKKELSRMHEMVNEAMGIVSDERDIVDFGKLLHESWIIKHSLTDKISTPEIDDIYDTALRAGAIGGKLLGAGGGGFMLFFARPEDQPAVKKTLSKLLHVPFNFENSGSEIIFHRPYSR